MTERTTGLLSVDVINQVGEESSDAQWCILTRFRLVIIEQFTLTAVLYPARYNSFQLKVR